LLIIKYTCGDSLSSYKTSLNKQDEYMMLMLLFTSKISKCSCEIHKSLACNCFKHDL